MSQRLVPRSVQRRRARAGLRAARWRGELLHRACPMGRPDPSRELGRRRRRCRLEAGVGAAHCRPCPGVRDRDFEPEGEILFTTVAVDDQVTIADWFRANSDDAVELRTREAVFGTRTTAEQRERNLELMVVSKESAVVAALEYLGVEAVVESGVGFNGVVEGVRSTGCWRSAKSSWRSTTNSSPGSNLCSSCCRRPIRETRCRSRSRMSTLASSEPNRSRSAPIRRAVRAASSGSWMSPFGLSTRICHSNSTSIPAPSVARRPGWRSPSRSSTC